MEKSRYKESQIVSVLGTHMTERLRRDFDCLGIDYNAFYPGEVKLEALETLLNAPEQPAEYQVFFYHSDHLGSSSFITDINGDATQHLQYLPFGEDLVHEQNTAAYLSPYTFSGKERDVEMRSIREDLHKASTTEQTALSYFGASYAVYPDRGTSVGEAGLSVWLSVDPLSDRYLSHTPYNYTMNNPVRLVDPDGRSVICETCPAGEEWDAFRNDNANWFYNAESNSATSIQNGEINISTTFYNEKVDGVAHDRYFSSLQAEAVIEALVMLGFDRDKAAQDVKPVNRYHAELQNSEFYMKALPMEAFDSKNWETPARQSKQLGNSLYALKLYPGRDNAIGLVYSDSYYHTLEAGAEILELLVGTILGPHYMHENNALGFLNAVK